MPERSLSLSVADLALLRSMVIWGPRPDASSWARLAAPWRARLQAAAVAGLLETDAAEARAILRGEHAAEARPDPGHIHETWWFRALERESPAVQRTVAAHAPEPMASALRRHYQLSEADLRPDRPPHAEAVRWALAFWSERLVGGPESRPNDPPVITALTRLDRRHLRRLVVDCGLAKLACVGPTPEALRGRDRLRFEHFQSLFPELDPRLIRLARQDLADRGDTPNRRDPARLGLLTFGRLLTTVEPFRARWALQHLPYPIARQTRVRLGRRDADLSAQDLIHWEERIFQAASGCLDQDRSVEREVRGEQDRGT
ncbi:hypothetical protein BH23PLA1_BH23PLA1_17390 [soil metagenome]